MATHDYYDIYEVYTLTHPTRKLFETDTKDRAIKFCIDKHGQWWDNYVTVRCRKSSWSIQDELFLVEHGSVMSLSLLSRKLNKGVDSILRHRRKLTQAGIACPGTFMLDREKDIILALYPRMSASKVADVLWNAYGYVRTEDAIRTFVSTQRSNGVNIARKGNIPKNAKKRTREQTSTDLP